MLIEFRLKNFRSFRDEQVLSLVASNYDKELHENVIEPALPGLKDMRVVKGAALYGANASGKSNVLLGLQAFHTLVRTSADSEPGAPIKVEPYVMDEVSASAPVSFQVTFVSSRMRFEYRVALNSERVLAEELTAFPEGKPQSWFIREWSPEKGSYEWGPDRPVNYQRDAKREEFTRPNALYLSTAVKLNDEQLAPVYNWFTRHLRFLNLAADGGIGIGFTASLFTNNTPMAQRVIAMLRHADFGVCGARAFEQAWSEDELPKGLPRELLDQIKKQKRIEVALSHRGIGERTVELPWTAESAGTRRFFGLAGPWLDILTNGYLVCVDELDTSMHPLMVHALLRLLFSQKNNPQGAQIVFTTHNPLLLDPTLMRRDQTWFTDKKDTGESFLYPLTDYKPRKGESLARGYLSGRYGAVPFIPDGLVPLEHAGGVDGR